MDLNPDHTFKSHNLPNPTEDELPSLPLFLQMAAFAKAQFSAEELAAPFSMDLLQPHLDELLLKENAADFDFVNGPHCFPSISAYIDLVVLELSKNKLLAKLVQIVHRTGIECFPAARTASEKREVVRECLGYSFVLHVITLTVLLDTKRVLLKKFISVLRVCKSHR